MVFNAIAILFYRWSIQRKPLTCRKSDNFIRNGVSSNKGVLIADIYICTTVYINLKNIPPREPRGIEIGPSFSVEGYNPPKKSLGV
jgi:hypothetical protein